MLRLHQSLDQSAAPSAPRIQIVLLNLALSPWLWGSVLTVGLYAAIPHLPVGQELAARYFCNHPLEYALAALFCVGLAVIAVKALTNRWERAAFQRASLFSIDNSKQPLDERLSLLKAQADQFSAYRHETYWGHRLHHLWAFLRGRPTAEGMADHLGYLSESAADRLHSSYALMNTIIWAIPIVGFLGTVMGITLAIANITPEQLESSMNEVTSGLAVAFDTTAVALSWSLVLGFASLFVKRSEEQLLGEIDEQSRLEVNRCFPPETPANPLFDAQNRAAQEVILQTDHLVKEQAELWRNTVEQFRGSWSETIVRQQSDLSRALDTTTADTVNNHARQLHDFRKEFVDAYSDVSETLRTELTHFEAQRGQATEQLRSTLTEFSEQLHRGLADQLAAQQQGTERALDQLATKLSTFELALEGWQEQFQKLAIVSQEHSEQLQSQTEVLTQLVGHEADLLHLQTRLTENLETVRSAETFDETLHNLTAAVHLLTARARAA
ncbi:MAG: MotA/TolQ/ExbB proton channel family protein [Planctomycetaceae bacterium]|nr:MotA/TolQ/ExbB proton channel family protein [Planctomycetaceae bacterium]